jgi:hypothetical protein
MPNFKGPVYSKLELLRACCDPTYKPKPMTEREIEESEEAGRFFKLQKIRRDFKWEWNAGAKYLYEELIKAYGIDGERRDWLIKDAKPRPGRKPAVDTALRVKELRQEQKTAKQIAKELGISVEAVESYSKRRREPSPEELARAAVNRAFRRRGKLPGDSSR